MCEAKTIIKQETTNIELISVYGNKECVFSVFNCIDKDICISRYSNVYLLDELEIRFDGNNCLEKAKECINKYNNNLSSIIPLLSFIIVMGLICILACGVNICKKRNNRIIPINTINTIPIIPIIPIIPEIQEIDKIQEDGLIECVICYNEINKYVKINCIHKLCKECYNQMKLRQLLNCPICRMSF